MNTATPIIPPQMTTNTMVVDTIKDLISICNDGRDGYRQASDVVDTGVYKTLFNEYATQREQFALKLGNLLVDLGYEPESQSGFMAALHRGWMNLRVALSSNDERTVLEECERGEDAAKDAYTDALEKPLPDNVRGVVQDQYEQIIAAHDRIRDLRNMKHASN